MSKKTKLLEALQKGEELTTRQITARFKLANPRAAISSLRIDDGFAIYANQRTNSKGQVTTKYRLGTPRKSVVAIGSRIVGA